MKKSLTMLALVLFVASGHIYAQTFQWGIKAGGNLSTFTSSGNSTYSSFSMQAGWNAGVFTNFMLGDHFSISPEVLYSRVGAKIKTTTTQNDVNVSTDDHLRLSYVNVPVMAKYKFTGGFFIETGPEVNFNVSSSRWQNQSVKDLTNGAEFAWGLGLGYQSPSGFGIGARYNQGISRVDKVGDATWNDITLHNSSFMLDLFWTFFNNKK